MRPRTTGKITIGVLTTALAVLAIIFGLRVHKFPDNMADGVRGIIAALLALTCATIYRYFED